MSFRYDPIVGVELLYNIVKVQILHYNVLIISAKCCLVTGILENYARAVSVSINKVLYQEAGLTLAGPLGESQSKLKL